MSNKPAFIKDGPDAWYHYQNACVNMANYREITLFQRIFNPRINAMIKRWKMIIATFEDESLKFYTEDF